MASPGYRDSAIGTPKNQSHTPSIMPLINFRGGTPIHHEYIHPMGSNRWRTCQRDAQHESDICDKRIWHTLHAHSDNDGMRTSAYEELLAHKPRYSASSDQNPRRLRNASASWSRRTAS